MLLVILFTHLLEYHIVSQLISFDGGVADKIEARIERSNKVGKRLERRY